MSHLSIADLLKYGDAGQDEKARLELRGHLESCHKCRERFISLQTFRSSLYEVSPKILSEAELVADCVPTELMGDFIGARLASNEQSGFSTHVAGCDLCFERAAYFMNSSIRMTEGVLTMSPTPARYREAVAPAKMSVAAKKSVSIWDMFIRWAASPVPAYAFAAVLLMFLVFGQQPTSGRIVALDADSSFAMYEQPEQLGPSFGFSDAGRKVGESPANLSVNVSGSDGGLNFTWKAVAGANEYGFTLVEVNAKGVREVLDTKTAKPEMAVDKGKFTPGHVYRWKVSGVTPDNKVFAAVGQFAYAK